MHRSIFLALLLLLFISLLHGAERVSIQIDPPFAAPGSNMWITCRIPRHADNRKVTMGIRHHRTTDYQIEGMRAPNMFRFLAQDMPCMPEVIAICLLETNKGRMLASKPVHMIACEYSNENPSWENPS